LVADDGFQVVNEMGGIEIWHSRAPQKVVIPAQAGIQYAVASRLNHENTLNPPSQTMTTGCVFALSRRDAPELCWILFALDGQRAQGRPGARCTRGLVCNVHKECAHEHTGPAESIRPSLRNGFTAYNELSPENGSFASVAP
jgi:hypothetical protein